MHEFIIGWAQPLTAPIKTEHPHVVRVPGIAGGRPTIAGTRISVDFIARFVQAGVEPREIIEMYPHLTPAGVYDAISYYYDHQEEIDERISESLESAAEACGLEIRADDRIMPPKPE